MNIKKAISLFILLFVNVMILAHAAIPHHHHEATSVFFTVYCEDCSDEHEHHTLTDTAYNTPSGKYTKHICCSYTNCDCKQNLNNLVANVLITQNFVDNTIIHFQQKPYFFPFYTEFVVQSLGLRAPPFFRV